MTDKVVAIDIDGDEDGIDGCDVEFHDAEATPDEALPMAVGGIAIEDEGDDTCGCDVSITITPPKAKSVRSTDISFSPRSMGSNSNGA